jgi:hypothetical protein
MRNAIVNASLPAFTGPGRNAGTVRDTVRVNDLRVLARCLVVITLTTGVLAFNAGELWPHLFAH